MILLKIIAFILLLFYGSIILYALIGFIKTKTFSAVPSIISTNVTIIICARNEENNITKCLQSILEQEFDFSRLELILVNDASSDQTLSIAENILFNTGIKYFLLTNTEHLGKKKSIIKAINYCSGDLIITRDADTYTESKNWLYTMVHFFECTKKELIIGPISYCRKNNLISQLQYFENAALAVFTGGFAFFHQPFLCNGANLAFSKKLFIKAGSYQDHLDIDSGDDVLFMEDVKKINSEAIAYLKQPEAIVYTYPPPNWTSLFRQKIRWASKTGKNPNKLNEIVAFLVVAVHFFSLFYLLLPLITHHISPFGIIFILIRFFIDFLLLFLASRYFNQPVNLLWYLPISLFYSIYVLITGFLSLIVKPNWK